MVEIFQGILLSSIFVSTTTAFVLLWRSYRDQINPSNRVLAFFLIIMAIYGVVAYVFEFYRTPLAIAIFYAHFTPTFYLIGPSIWIYIRNTISDRHDFKKSDLLHLIPFLLHVLSLSAYLFSPFDEKLDMAMFILEDSDNLLYNDVSALFPTKWNYFLRPSFTIAYASYSLGYVVKTHFERPVKSSYWLSIQSWFYVFLGTNLLVYVSYLGLFVAYLFLDHLSFREVQDQTYFLQVSGVLFVFLSILPLLFPHILYGNIRLSFTDTVNQKSYLDQNTSNSVLINKDKSDDSIALVDKNKTGSLENVAKKEPLLPSSKLELLDYEIDKVLRQSKPFLNPNFDVRQIAEILNIPVYHMNYYFSEYKGIRFVDYRTKLRIKHAIELIESGEANQLTIEGVAFASGYRSRSTFINHFKQETNKTPSEYIQERLKSQE